MSKTKSAKRTIRWLGLISVAISVIASALLLISSHFMQRQASAVQQAKLFSEVLTVSLKSELLAQNDLAAFAIAKRFIEQTGVGDKICLKIIRSADMKGVADLGNSYMCESLAASKISSTIFFDSENSEAAYYLNLYFGNELGATASILPLVFAILVIAIIGIGLVLAILRSFDLFVGEAVAVIGGKSSDSSFSEINGLRMMHSRFLSADRKAMENQIESERLKELQDLSFQLSHDIRSPATALSLLARALVNVPEEQRNLLRMAANRINEIANRLLLPKKQELAGRAAASVELIATILNSIIAESRLRAEKDRIKIIFDSTAAIDIFANVNVQDLKRVLSNILNNALEAVEPGRGVIAISVSVINGRVQVKIRDNGCGITPEVLTRLGTKEVTTKKMGSQSGTGIGLFHARRLLNAMAGELSISSVVGEGSEVLISVPAAERPSWCAQSVDPKSVIVVVDDEPFVHQHWKRRFDAFLLKCQIVHLYDLKSFKNWLHENQAVHATYLVDHDFKDSSENGLEFIRRNHLEEDSILVTNRIDDERVRTNCIQYRVKMVGKDMIDAIPFKPSAPA